MRWDLSRWFGQGGAAAAPPRRAALRARRRRLGGTDLEALERRALLATLSVGPSVNMSKLAGSEEETAIAINPTNPNNLFAAAIGAQTGQVASVSFDGGATWATRIMSNGTDGTPVACCDASVAFDTFGNLFFTYLSDSIHTVVVMSTDGGLSFTNVADFGTSDQPTIVTGPGDQPGTQSVWVTYNKSGTIQARGARVTGLGQVGAFSAEQAATNGVGNFGDIAIGPNGAVFVTYMNPTGGQGPAEIFGNLDPDGLGPQGFGARVKITDTNVGGFDFFPGAPLRSVDAEAGLAWDRSGGPHNGRMYLIYTDEEPDESDNMDIYVRFSDDNGQTWSARALLNDDGGTNSQYLPKIALDQTTGAVAAVWMDARFDTPGGSDNTNGIANDEAVLYATVTLDGGATWLPNVRVGPGPSNANTPGGNGNGGFNWGDYIGLAFHDKKFFPIWPDNSTQLSGNPDRPNFDLATAQVSVQQLEVTPIAIQATENAPFSGAVARFNPFNPGAVAGDFTATIDWGDGSPVDTGTITSLGNGQFQVSGTHTYLDGGTYTTQITVVQTGGNTAAASGQALVENLPIFVTGTFVDSLPGGGPILEGDEINDLLVATFVDTDPDETNVGDYSVTIVWGDDDTVSAGQLTKVGYDPLVGTTFEVRASHRFGSGPGNPPSIPQGGVISSVVVATPAGATATGTNTVVVVDSDLEEFVVAGDGFDDLKPVEGQPFTLPVARFIDTDPRLPPKENYFATINWGDGAVTSGVILVDPNNGGFLVAGNHAYDLKPGVPQYNLTITVGNFAGYKTVVLTATARVVAAPINVGALNYTVGAGQTLDKFLATFVDTDPRAHPASRYAAIVTWGDGSTSDSRVAGSGVQVVVNTDGGFLVRGQHAYHSAGVKDYKVEVVDTVSGGPAGVDNGQINVTPAFLGAQVVTTATPLEGLPFDGVIATFTTTNQLAEAKDYTATVDWGDQTVFQTPDLTIEKVADGSFVIKAGSKAYAQVGGFRVSVSVTGNGAGAFANGTIRVGDAPLTGLPVGALTVPSKTALTGLLIGRFTDTDPKAANDPAAALAKLTATVLWGDGSAAEPARISADPNQPGSFLVTADHSFLGPGSFQPRVTVTSRDGSTVTLTAQVTAEPRLFPISGRLSTADASPNAGNVARGSDATLVGSAEPGATVTVYLATSGKSDRQPIGEALADANGGWTLTTNALADGAYDVFASAVDARDVVSSNLAPIMGAGRGKALVVDTTGPTVRRIEVVPTRGTITATLTDNGSGLLGKALANRRNYALQIVGNSTIRTLRVKDLVLKRGAGGARSAELTFAGLPKLGPGTYAIMITSKGITDVAGNILDERFFVPFPGLYTRSGQDFVAQFTSNGLKASELRQFVPPPEITAAQLFKAKIGRLRVARR
jgi:hypothetical protein